MNRTARTFIATATLVVVPALGTALGAFAPAHADGPNGPGQIGLGPIVDPEPNPQPDPGPTPEPKPLQQAPKPKDPKPQVDGPGEIAAPPHCTHGCGGGGPQGPGDLAQPTDEPGDEPTDGPAPTPGDDPAQDPEQGPTLDQGCFTGCDLPELTDAAALPLPDTGGFDVPGAQTPDAAATVAPTEDGSNDWIWVILGGAALSSGAAYAVRRRTREQDA